MARPRRAASYSMGLAYALSFTALMLLIDFGLIRALEHRATRWRTVPG
ncbi:hypothetical protein HGD87_06460 [Rhodobacteraceae bacterium R_SAG9]|nr:hypothetical protein [Rhodobacteraceae bacterium R_SAG9]